MFERFTERARQVVVGAQEESRQLRHATIGPEHLLLGVLLEPEALGARVLAALDVTPERVREIVVMTRPRDTELPGGQVPFTERCKRVLELSLREALSLGHNYIGTEHILLALCRESEAVSAIALGEILGGEWADTIGNEIIRQLHGPRTQPVDEVTALVELARIGDQMQSAASRLAAFVQAEGRVPYEVALGAHEIAGSRGVVAQWTAARSRMR